MVRPARGLGRLGASSLLIAVLGAPKTAEAGPDDVFLAYDAALITRVVAGDEIRTPTFLRQSFAAELGFGDFGLGLLVQDAQSLGDEPAEPEVGLMLTIRYDQLLAEFLRLEALGRVGLTHHVSDPSRPLYATDTDLRAGLVFFDPVGIGPPGSGVFLSGHFGGSVNWVGRPQLITGFGAWWRQIGIYTTGFWSLTGVSDPIAQRPEEDAVWARIDNAGVSFALSYDLELGRDETVRLEVRQNLPLRNGGFDTALAVSWRIPWLEGPSEVAAW